jgi:hypothetical protein
MLNCKLFGPEPTSQLEPEVVQQVCELNGDRYCVGLPDISCQDVKCAVHVHHGEVVGYLYMV